MSDDDDLPVLTQILRTGHADRTEGPEPTDHRDRTVDALDPRSTARAPAANPEQLANQLVIGHEAARTNEDYLAPSFHVSPPIFPRDHATTTSDEDVMHRADAFNLSQDHDAPQALGLVYDEPEYSAEPPPRVAHPESNAFAERVRDAVLDQLSARIETELDARIAQAIHVEIETALGQLQARLRNQLSEALKDVVGRAVDEEIVRLAAQPPIDD